MLAIKEITIKNFRSIHEETFVLGSFTALIGKNDVGKSNLLEAIQILFEGSAAGVDVEDFYDADTGVEISAVLSGVKDYLDLCDQQNRPKIEKLIDGDGHLRIRRLAPKPRALGKIEIRDPANGEFKTPTGIDAPLKAMLPEIIYIEALADVSDELKGTQKDALGKLLAQVMSDVAQKVEPDLQKAYQEANAKLNVQGDGSDKRVEELKDIEAEVTKYLKETFPRDAVMLKVTMPSVKEMLAKVDVFVGDGKAIDPYYRKGQGLQRALYLSLLRTLASKIRAGTKKAITQPFIILCEEPEAFLHPAGQAKMRVALQTVASTAQVIISTHSPIMVSPESIEQVLRVEKRLEDGLPKPVTRRHGPIDPAKLSEQEKALLKLFSIQRSSRFLFSRGVLLVEGEGDEHLVNAIFEKCAAFRCEDNEIAVIEVGGKDAIKTSAEILRMLGLRVWSIVDLDFLWRGAGSVLGGDPDLSKLIEEAKKVAKYDAIPESDGEQRKQKMTAAVLELAQKRDGVCQKLRGHGIYVLRHGETELYVGLGKNRKGEYLKAAADVRKGTRDVLNAEDFAEVIADLKEWSSAAG